jgi:hypothetical protein
MEKEERRRGEPCVSSTGARSALSADDQEIRNGSMIRGFGFADAAREWLQLLSSPL